MAQRTREQLKTFFETGDVPTEAEFSDLIDSIFNLSEDAHDSLKAIKPAGIGVINGHVTNAAQNFEGEKNLTSFLRYGNLTPEFIWYLKPFINNLYGAYIKLAYSASTTARYFRVGYQNASGVEVDAFEVDGNDGSIKLLIAPTTDSGTNDILTWNASTKAIEKRSNAYTALTAGAAVSFSLAIGLNKTLNIAVSSTITFSDFVSGMQGDIRLNVTSVSTITLAASGVTFYGVGNLADLPIGIYHIAYTVISSTVIDYNINTTPYA